MKKVLLFFALFMLTHTAGAEVSYNTETKTLTILSHTSANEIHNYGDTRTLVIETAEGLDDMGYQFGQYLPNLETLILPSDIVTVPAFTFKNCKHLVNVNWGDLVNLKTIGQEAFMESGLGQTLTIPNSVETIENGAFAMCNNIKTLIFDEGSQIQTIKRDAFKQSESTDGKLSDVYINVKPAREIVCEHMAFDKFHTAAQTNVGTVTTRLHYPSEYFEYYVGTYKSTLYDQNYDVKDENGHWVYVKDENGNNTSERVHSYGIITQSIMDQSYSHAGNGWQEFMSSGIPIGSGSLYRTYSDEVAYKVPYTSEFQIYLVYDYDDYAYCIQMKAGDVIPAKTGVIVHSSIAATIYLEYVADPEIKDAYNNESFPNNFYVLDGVEYRNYLKPINGNLHIDNVETVNGVKTYRNYFFNNGETAALRPGPDWNPDYITKGWGFFRAVSKDYRVFNKAFLHLPASMTEPQSEYIEDSGTLPQEKKQQQSNAKDVNGFEMYVTNWADMIIECHCPKIATGICEKHEHEADNVFYTLEGVKISNPIRGVYIKNGKKIVVK